MTPDEIHKKMLHDFSNHENGPAAESLKRLGQAEKHIFGCTVADIKRIAGKYSTDTQQLRGIWKKEVRESKLSAIFMLNQAQISNDLVLEIANELNNGEQGEQLGFEVIGKKPEAREIAFQLLNSDNNYTIQTGFISLARFIQTNGSNAFEIDDILIEASKYLETEHIHLRNAVSRILRAIATDSEYGFRQVSKLIKKLKKSETLSSQWLYTDVQTTLDFIKPV